MQNWTETPPRGGLELMGMCRWMGLHFYDWIDHNGVSFSTEKNNGFPFLDILGYLKNIHKNPKFGRVRQVPIRELGWEFPGWDLSHFAKFGIFMGIL